MATNRTLQFVGCAYGNVPVQITANINNTTVFNGTVSTLDEPIPDGPTSNKTFLDNPILFSIENNDLFTTDFSGTYPLSVTVTGGDGITLGPVKANFMQNTLKSTLASIMADCSIEGTTLTVGSIFSGNISVGQGIMASNTHPGGIVIPVGITITAGSDLTWTLSDSLTVPTTNILGYVHEQVPLDQATPGNATGFVNCFNGTPTNSEGTPDRFSDVKINGTTQVPLIGISQDSAFPWRVLNGQTLECNFNISLGNIG